MNKLKKIIAKLPTGFAEEAGGLDDEGLKEVILQASANIAQVEKARDSDEKRTGAMEILKDINGSYTDALKAQKAKIDYALHLLEERGSPLCDDGSVEGAVKNLKTALGGAELKVTISGGSNTQGSA